MSEIFKSLLWDRLVSFALQKIFAAVPLLGWGPIGWIVTWAVNYVATKLFEAIDMFLRLESIRLKNETAQREWEMAAIELRLLALDKGVSSPEFLKKRAEEHEKFSKFIRFDVAR